MKFLARSFFRGLAAILPLALTGYLIWAAVFATEVFLRSVVLALFDLFGVDWHYRPGMGFVFSIALVLAVGMLMYSFVVRTVYGRITGLLQRIPIVKSIYGTLVDIVQLLGGEQRPFRQVVLVRAVDGSESLGLLSREDCADLPGFPADHVAVYLPMSFQIGGFMLILPRERVREIGMPVEQALRLCVTAGLKREEPA